MILATLNDNNIPFSDCRGQGYDNARNMSGCYNGTQSHLLAKNPLCLFSPCGRHSLNLCGVDSANAESTEAVTFFGMVQKIYNLFSSCPKRWKILTDHIGGSLHGLSETRWTARVASIRPFAKNLPGIKAAVEELLSLNLTPQTSVDVRGAISYTSSFICILMSAIWVKLLIMIDHRNQIIQFRGCWPLVWDETIHVATSMNISTSFPSTRSRKRKHFFDDLPELGEEDHSEEKEIMLKQQVFFTIIDSVLEGLIRRFKSIQEINELFSFLWKYPILPVIKLEHLISNFSSRYNSDVCQDELKEEVFHLKAIHTANFGTDSLGPLNLLNKIVALKLEELFPNICISLRIFCTLPVTVATGERSFSKLKLIKNFLRTSIGQDRLNSLAIMSIEHEIARKIDYSKVIGRFASLKARKELF